MPRIYDCFLYNDERELLSIRIELLAPTVHKFVIVWSSETFTGLNKRERFPLEVLKSHELEGRIELIELGALIGNTAWEKESFSRNALMRGIADAGSSDLIMVSDIDEIPRPSVLAELAQGSRREWPVVLVQDYYNFKFNYKLIHGLQAVWAGPVLCRLKDLKSAQELRDTRWVLLDSSSNRVEDAGWHFSYLTVTADVSKKLTSFSHQEDGIQSRRENIDSLIATRHGFHDHLHPACVWAVVPLNSFNCPDLERLISRFPALLVNDNADDSASIHRAIRHSVRQLCLYERSKMLSWFRWRELVAELLRRLNHRISGLYRKI